MQFRVAVHVHIFGSLICINRLLSFLFNNAVSATGTHSPASCHERVGLISNRVFSVFCLRELFFLFYFLINF